MLNIRGLLLGLALGFPAPKDSEPSDKNQGFFGIQLVDESGVKVTLVQPGSPAEKGGVKVDDLLLTIEDQRIPNVEDCREIIARLRPGRVVKVEVRRGQMSVALKIKIGVRPMPMLP